ncbi:MAG: amidohydrolase family protein [Polyangiaceae bacterium]
MLEGDTAPCAASMQMPIAALNDDEGERVDPELPFIVDAHVHLFSDRIFDAIWRWFEQHGWRVRYQLHTPQALEFLLSRGIGQIVALHYAHKAGIARGMNAYLAEVCRTNPRVTGLATVFPGEENAPAILEEGFALGLHGVKLHCHVQCFAVDADPLRELYETCVRHDMPLVMHAGREPKSTAYGCDPYEICGVERVDRVLREHPKLRLCVPHLGADEFEGYERLLEKYDNLWLDTTMMLADFFPRKPPNRLILCRPERIMYGTDFPNLPYAWDRELARIRNHGMNDAVLEQVLGKNARAFFRIPEQAGRVG